MKDLFVSVWLLASAARHVTSAPELDESCMLQHGILHVPISAVEHTQLTSASDVLAGARLLVDAVRENNADVANITIVAKEYAFTLESEVVPNIMSAIEEMRKVLATQRIFVQQCDAKMREDSKANVGLSHEFSKQKTALMECEDAQIQADECEELRAAVDAAACGFVSHANGVCDTYMECRSNSIALYEHAARSMKVRAEDHRTQLAEAKQAQCIARGLVESAGEAEKMLKQLDGCTESDSTRQASDELGVNEYGNEVPSMATCEAVTLNTCVGDHVELAINHQIWSAPCQACPKMTQVSEKLSALEFPLQFTLKLLMLRAGAFVESALDFGQRNSPTLSFFVISVNSNSTASITASVEADVEQMFMKQGTLFAGPNLAFMIGVPLAAIAIAVCIAFAITPNRRGPSDSKSSPMDGVKGQAQSPKLLGPSSRQSMQSTGGRPSVGGAYGRQAPPPGLGTPFESPLPSQIPAGLCPELVVPEGSECILGLPSLAAAAQGEVTLKNITDKTGDPLLYVGLTGAPAGGEYVLLAKKDQQELAFCELGASLRAEGWSGKIFRWDGELYARLREVGTPGPPRAGPTNHRTFVVLSAVGCPWELRVTGDFRAGVLSVEDGARKVVAMVSPGAGDFGAGYKLRLGPHADSCTVIIALLAIERLLGQ